MKMDVEAIINEINTIISNSFKGIDDKIYQSFFTFIIPIIVESNRCKVKYGITDGYRKINVNSCMVDVSEVDAIISRIKDLQYICSVIDYRNCDEIPNLSQENFTNITKILGFGMNCGENCCHNFSVITSDGTRKTIKNCPKKIITNVYRQLDIDIPEHFIDTKENIISRYLQSGGEYYTLSYVKKNDDESYIKHDVFSCTDPGEFISVFYKYWLSEYTNRIPLHELIEHEEFYNESDFKSRILTLIDSYVTRLKIGLNLVELTLMGDCFIYKSDVHLGSNIDELLRSIREFPIFGNSFIDISVYKKIPKWYVDSLFDEIKESNEDGITVDSPIEDKWRIVKKYYGYEFDIILFI